MEVSTNFVDTYVFYPKNVSLVSAFGKWLVFCSKVHIDTMWAKLHSILDALVRCGSALCMCVSTARPNQFATHTNIGVIMIYTPSQSTSEHTRHSILEVANVLHAAFQDTCGFAAPDQFSPYSRIFYKTQTQSREGSRMTGKTKGNSLTSICLPDRCVAKEICNFDQWIEKKQSTQHYTQHDLLQQSSSCFGLNPVELHALGALWDPKTNHWFAPTDKVLQRMNNLVAADAASALPPPSQKELLSVMSINIWGNVDGFQHPEIRASITARMQSILATIESLQPDVLCLQEAQKDEVSILHPQLCAQGYLATDTQDRSVLTYVHSVHIRLEWSEYSERPVRLETLCLTHKATTLSFTLANVHLPSGKQTASLRLLALQQSILGLQATKNPWVLIGDTNLTFEQDSEMEHMLPPQALDAWVAAGSPMDRRATFDFTKNTNLSRTCSSSKVGARLDRAIFDCSKLTLVDFKLVCTDIVAETNTHPSDHFGLFLSFAL